MKMKRLHQLLRGYLALGVIVGPAPFVIVNGQAIDATPVMADLNWIIAQVNANAADAGALAAVSAALNTINASYGVTSNAVPAWTTTGVAPAIGNGSITGRTVLVGKHLHWVMNVLFGTTSTFGTNAWRFGLPSNYNGTLTTLLSAQYELATGTGKINTYALCNTGNPSFVNILSAAGTPLANTTGGWGNGGTVTISGVYEVA